MRRSQKAEKDRGAVYGGPWRCSTDMVREPGLYGYCFQVHSADEVRHEQDGATASPPQASGSGARRLADTPIRPHIVNSNPHASARTCRRARVRSWPWPTYQGGDGIEDWRSARLSAASLAATGRSTITGTRNRLIHFVHPQARK